ncbi:LBP_cg2779 family protein [uncultured Lactobacillus sp.]|uniref:LBP_cg2779 family protein n=1 Tax=uncultured Lactobacillus sp. TaxID=153152 RepID=UPI0025E981BA|nr:LBP_cg2779 family protein [uncultured Lactobacillus sp.]
MNQQLEGLSDAIIDFQVKHHVTDTDLAFASHLSVEKIHAMKTGEGEFTPEEINQLYDYLAANH